tara:strand:- start:4505 stop:10054 length:5550 start_codon:yes stop_codon:yes gene_type:complete
MKLVRSFIQGIMNKGLDERLIPDGQYRDALNIEVSASEGAGVGAVENIRGNTNVTNQTFTGTGAKTIGAIADEANNNIYWFVTDSDFDYVLKFNEVNSVTTTVLKDTKGRVLKFNSSYLITGVNIIDDLLFWTDNLNPPRRINVKKYYAVDGFIEDDISVIVKPPINAPLIELNNSSTQFQENNLKYKFLQFACRYKYENDEYSALSSFSSTAFFPSAFNYVLGEDSFESMTNTFNQVIVDYFVNGSNPGSGWVPDPRIKEIQLVFRDTSSTNINIIESFKIEDILNDPSLGIDANGRFTNTFDNSKIYTVLPPDEITRLFDNVPLKARAQELIGSRIAYGNYLQFYNIEDSSGTPIDIDYDLEVDSRSVPLNPLPSFRSDRDYEIGLVYLDEYSRMTTVLTANNNTLNIDPSYSDTANDIRVSINNEAPSFAKKYRIFIKQAKGDYYNIFVLYYEKDGIYTWFEIDPSDVDKVPIGSYVILKTEAGLATESNKQYKVLDVQSQPDDFLGGGEKRGLYFKLKIDDTSLFDGGDLFEGNNNTSGRGSVYQNVSGDWKSFPYIAGLDAATGGGAGVVNYPIYYGRSTTHNTISPQFGFIPQFNNDFRLKIIITPPDSSGVSRYRVDKFELNSTGGGYVPLKPATNITSALQEVNYSPTSGLVIYSFTFDFTTGYKVGDYWIVNIHEVQGSGTGSTLGGVKNRWEYNQNSEERTYHTAIVQDFDFFNDDQGNAITGIPQPGYPPIIDRPIKAGARIKINVEDLASTQNEFISPRNYLNIEEWFWESGAYKDFKQLGNPTPLQLSLGTISSQFQNQLGSANVFFRRGFSRGDASTSGCPDSNRIFQKTFDPATGLPNNPPGNVSSWSEYLATQPIWMMIRGTKQPNSLNPTNCDSAPVINVFFEIVQQENANVFETVPSENPADIYHELSDTFDIVNREHQGNVSNQSLTSNSPAVISLNTSTNPSASTSEIENSMYNAYCFGNGVEGLRIRGDFNAPTLKYSPRVSSVIEDYQQQRVEEAITYSGIYRENTGINNLNEFNLSLANFKYLDKFFGSIQKLHARDTDVVAFQENKVSKILYGKNLLSDAVGGGAVASIPEVLGTQITYTGEYGISENPESFATWGNDMYFTDSRRGAVMRLGLNGMFEISSQGMRNYFKQLFISNSRTQHLGVIDPFKERYVLATNNTANPPCNFKVVPRFDLVIGSQSGTYQFSVGSNTEWTISWTGTGITSVNGVGSPPYSGEDSAIIDVVFSTNSTGANRTFTITFQACGQSYPFTIIQSGKTRLIRKVVVVGNSIDSGLIANQKYDFTSNTTGGDIDFDGVKLVKNSLSLDNDFNSFEGVDSMPASGDTVTLKAGVTGTSTIKPFNPNFGNALRYLVSNVEYGEDDVKTLISLSSATTPSIVGSNYEGSFTFSRTTEKFLYLIYDYRNNVTPPATLTSSASISGTVNSIVDYTNRRGNVSIRCIPSGTNSFTVKWNDRIVGQAINISVVTDIVFFKNELLPGEVQVIVEGGGTFTAQAGASTLASFAIDTTNDTLTSVCASTTSPDTKYHSGSPGLPTVGDIVYNELSGLTTYDGNNSFHRIGPAPTTDYAVISKEGLVLIVGSCSSCSEVAVPVINQPNITLTVGDSIDLKIPVSNNPISFALSTTCNKYQLNGGANGALFTTTDCDTGNTINTTVNANSFQEICTTSVPVLVSGTGTSSLLGTCDDYVLPTGITFDKFNGVFGGVATVSGTYSVRLTATNCFGTSAINTIVFTINPLVTEKRFNMDTTNAKTSSTLACGVTPSYSIMYHSGEGEYPVVNDFIYEMCDCNLKIYKGGYLWFITDQLTGVKNNVIRVDDTGQVVEKVVCP